MLARGWSTTAGSATLTTAAFAAKFSSQSQALNFSCGMPTRFDKPRKVDLSYMPCSKVLDSEGNGNVRFTSSDLVEREYADLNLKDLYDDGKVGHVRIRQHVNPLSSSFSVPVDAPDWDDVFNDSKLPLMVDIGSVHVLREAASIGSGRFLIWLAKRFPDSRNFLGLEIRHKCPDPHFKKRHHKRRVLQKPLVDSILNNLITGGQVSMQSDVLQVAMDMRDQLDLRADVLSHIDAIDGSFSCDKKGWLQYNPFGIRTEREIHAQFEGAQVYRRMYQKL